MSLKIAAEHLKAQGRGPDTELIHMTKGEIKGLRQLAQAHGGDLTVNPTTGLPEAGFLSSALPMVLGAAAAATGQEWAVPLAMAMSAGGEYAMTGSLTQGLMAGLGAWGGAGLESGLAGLGAESAVEAGTATGNEAFNTEQAALTQQFPTATPESVNQAALQQSITSQNFPNYSPEQLAQIQASGTNAANPQEFMQSVGQGNASLGSNVTNPTFADSLSNAGKGITSGNLGQYAMGHLGQVAAVGLPLIGSALTKNPTANTQGVTNNTSGYGTPIQRISPNFQGSFPTQPDPHYQAKYPNYVQNPYNPYSTSPTGMAAGGVADSSSPLEGMAVGGATGMFPQSQITSAQYATPSQMNTGAQAVAADYDTKTNPMTGEMMPPGMAGGGAIAFKTGDLVSKYDGSQYDPRSYMGANNPYDPQSYIKHGEAPAAVAADATTYQDSDPDTRNLDAFSAALTKQAKIRAAAKMPTAGVKAALPKASSLGSGVSSDSYMAQLAAAKQAQQAQQAPTQLPEVDSAEGGVIGMAGGGATPQVYHPQYTNYQQTPYQQVTRTPADLQAATQAYIQQGIAAPTRTPMASSTGQNTAGYAIDPKGMVGSPAYQAIQDQLKAAQDAAAAAQAQVQAQQNSGGGGGGKAGGIMPHALRYANGGLPAYAMGGQPSLGSYSDGGHLLKGPGDGMSDSIPAQIGAKQPARLADGEFVVPADVVSHLGNGSTEAGAKHLYAMMDKIRKARTGRKKQAPQVNATKFIPK